MSKLLTSILLIASPVVLADEVCENGDLRRTVSVVYAEPGKSVPCEVVYDKTQEGAGSQTLWRAQNQEGYCEARAAEFVEKLEGLGWQCEAETADNAD